MKKALLVGIVLSLICAIVGCGQKEKAQYTLTFYSEGEVVHTLTAEEGLTIALREEADDPVKAEDGKNTYTFAGWTLGEEGELTESYTVTGDASFYATFTATPIVYYSVNFVDEWEGTRTVLSEQQVRAGKCAELPAQSPEHEGYTFTGWSPDPSAAVTQDTEYVAQYDVNTYKLTLCTPIGETEAQYDFGAELLLEEPELPDFLSFADWYADEDFTQPFALEKMPARDVQVYAKCEFDFGAAKLSVGENLVYGGNNTVSVGGLPADEKIVYTYLWKDGQNNGTAESYALHAGRHELSVTVKATFNEVEGEKTFTSTVDVAKKALTGTIEGVETSVVYGTRVTPTLKVEGAVGGDEIPAAKIEITGDKEGDPLPVGSYTVTASLPDLNDYSFEAVTKQFEVVKKELTATLSAEQTTIVYGNTFAPTLTFAGFIEGENDSVVKRGADLFRYEKDGANYTEKRFEVGSYTLSVVEGALTADNYSFAAISSCTLTVQKAALTVTVQMVNESYVYGETPQASVTHTEFAYSDETETAVFGSELTPSLPAHEGKYYNVGHYTVTAGDLQAKNYEITVNTASFDVTKKAVTVTLGEAAAVYGDAFAISAPTVSGLLEDEQGKETDIIAALRYSCEATELTLQNDKYSADVLFTVGAHTLTANAEGLTLDNYSLSTTNGTLTVTARPFTVSSQTTQVRDEKYEFTPKFEGSDAELFSASGKLVLKTQDTGSYTCSGSALSDSFLWEEPLKIVHSGEEVTENFSISYELNVTLDNSTFTLSIPDGKELVYDGQEHTFPVTANPIEGEQGTVVPLFEYTVNKEKIEGVPTFKDAGEYEVSCTITAKNYNTAESSFTVNIAKAKYTVKAEDKEYTYEPDCSFGENVEVTAVQGNEYTVTYSYLGSETQEAPKFTKAVGKAVVSFTVSEGKNYEEYKGSYTVTVAKAKGTIDVNGVNKNYVYTGELQTINEGATSNNKEDGELTYSDNEFTTVAQGNALTVKVTLSEGENYTSAEATFQIHVDKAKGTINVDGVKKDYTYTGAVQTINEGATTNNNEGDGKLTYSDNTFTTVAEGNALTVKVTLSEGANYTGAEATFTITVAKAKGTIDVSGVKKDYTYTGAVQTVEGGATSNNQEDAQFTYSDNTFTTVAEGNALDVKVTLKEGANYTSAETTFKITVAKQTLERLPEEASPQIPVQINERGKTLESVTFPDGKFSWQDTGTELVIGEHGYAATYDPDPENINPLTVTITFTTRKQVLTVEVTGGEADYTKGAVVSSLTLATLALTDESGEECSAEVEEYIDFKTDGKNLTLDVGSTYSVPWTLTFTENDYYELQYGDTKQASFHDECTFKWKSVELESKLYTVEDALKLLESGKMATVKFNTSFATAAIAALAYPDASYYTIPASATLLVPYGAADTGATEQPSNTYLATAATGYVTLTLPVGELIIEGKLLVNAVRVSASNFSGMVRGSEYGSLSLAKDTKVTVKSGATFESMGFTYGEGEVFAESGSTVYEPFAMPGWKGGSVAMMCGFFGVFPLNQYTFSSFISKVHLQTGASYKLRMSVTASSKAYDSEVEFIGQEDTAFLQLTDGVLIKYLDESNGKVHFDVEGTISFHNLSLSVGGSSASTSGMQVPIPGNFAFTLKTGSVTVTNGVQLKLLPGASLTTEAGTQLIIADGGKLLAYGDKNYTLSNSLTQWQDGTVVKSYPSSHMTGSYRKAPNFGYNGSSQAEVLIKGKFTAEGKATVCATFRGAKGATLELAEGVVTTAQVKEDLNASKGSFFTTTFNCGDLAAGNYTYTDGTWVKA